MNKGKKHVGCSVNINAMEHYIKSINFFDPNSMVMRYPIDKDLTANKINKLFNQYKNKLLKKEGIFYDNNL